MQEPGIHSGPESLGDTAAPPTEDPAWKKLCARAVAREPGSELRRDRSVAVLSERASARVHPVQHGEKSPAPALRFPVHSLVPPRNGPCDLR